MREIKVKTVREVNKVFEPESPEYSTFMDFTVQGIKEAFEQNRKEALVCNVDVEEDSNYVYTLSFYQKQWVENLEGVRDFYNYKEKYDEAIDTHLLMQKIQESLATEGSTEA